MEDGSKKGMILPFIRLAITFRDIHYYVPMPEVGPALFGLAVPSNLMKNKPDLNQDAPCAADKRPIKMSKKGCVHCAMVSMC